MKWSESRSVVSNSLHTVHGILQARVLEWVAFPFSRGSSQPRDRTQVSHIAGRFFTSWATGKPKNTGVGQSVSQFSHSVVSDSLRPHKSQHTRPPCPSPTPRVHPDSRPSSPGDLPNLGIKPGSPALQADSLPTELSGKPLGSKAKLNRYLDLLK